MKLLLLLSFLSFSFFARAQNVGIGTNNPAGSALLDLTSNSQGVLVPRMLKTERTGIASPADGLMVYQSGPDSIGFYYFHNTWRWLNNENSLPSSAIVMSATQNNTNLLNNNFSYKGQLTIPNAFLGNSSFTSTPNTWYSTNFNTAPLPPNGAVNFLSTYYNGFFYVWGGYSGSTTGVGLYKYDPVANTWTQLQGVNNITAKASGVVANGKWVIWGGLSSGAPDIAAPAFVYDFAGNTISTGPATADTARSATTAVAVGNDVYFWGGFRYNNNTILYSNGFKYSTTANTFTPISSVSAPSWRYYAGGVSTGTKILIWGGYNTTGLLNTGGVYDIAGNSWTAMSTTNAPVAGSINPIMAWTGTNLIVISGNETKQYNPGTNTWTTLVVPPISFGAYNGNKFAYDGSSKIYIWGGGTYYFSGIPTAAGYVYDIAANTYTALPAANAPSARAGQVVVYGNNELFVWSGSASTSNAPTTAETVITGGRYILNAQTISSVDSLGSIYLYQKN